MFLFLLAFFSVQLFALPSARELRDLKVTPRSEIFFTQMENCYALELVGVAPAQVTMELPDLPLGTKFISSKKEEFISQAGERGTLISLWFTFSESGDTRIPPLLVKLNGNSQYFEFEPIFVYENPNLISPRLEISFENKNLRTQNGTKTLAVTQGEKISFTVALRYGTQILDFKWKIPRDSIFTESERFEFANGTKKITQFTIEKKNLARFDWQILKAGEYALPEISVETIAFNGTKKKISLSEQVRVIVTEKQAENAARSQKNGIFASAFEKPQIPNGNAMPAPTREECKKIAEETRLSFFDKIFSRKKAIFAGGEINSVPEEKISSRHFAGGQKVRIRELAGDWAFIECEEFSGWTNRENLYEIK